MRAHLTVLLRAAQVEAKPLESVFGIGDHIVSVPLQHVVILVHDLGQTLAQVLHAVGSGHVASPVHSCLAVQVDYYVFVAFLVELAVDFLNQLLYLIEVYQVAHFVEEGSRPVGHLSRVQKRPQHHSAAVLGYLRVLLKIVFLDVSQFGLLRSVEIKQADDNESVALKLSELGEVAPKFFHLKMLALSDGDVPSHEVVSRCSVGVDYAQPMRQQICLCRSYQQQHRYQCDLAFHAYDYNKAIQCQVNYNGDAKLIRLIEVNKIYIGFNGINGGRGPAGLRRHAAAQLASGRTPRQSRQHRQKKHPEPIAKRLLRVLQQFGAEGTHQAGPTRQRTELPGLRGPTVLPVPAVLHRPQPAAHRYRLHLHHFEVSHQQRSQVPELPQNGAGKPKTRPRPFSYDRIGPFSHEPRGPFSHDCRGPFSHDRRGPFSHER